MNPQGSSAVPGGVADAGGRADPLHGLRIDVLGAPVITHDGADLAVDTRKAVALLAVLVVGLADGHSEVPRAELSTMLWPDVDDTRARATLRRTLSVLVAASGSAVRAERASVSLDPGQVISDLLSFRALAGSADREDLARAVGLVRGQLLAGFALRDSAPFDDWVARTSDGLRRDLGSVLHRLVVARLRHGELHAGLADATRWLELDPLHEPAHRSVMRLLAWTGRRQDALDHYHRCVRVLADELGVVPVRATTEVYETIRAGTLPPPRRAIRPGGATPAGAPSARPTSEPGAGPDRNGRGPSAERPTDLPTARPVDRSVGRPLPLVGRDRELGRLRSVLGATGRLVTLSAEGGVGRSRLVDEFVAGAGDCLVVRAHGGEAALSFAPIADLIRAAVALRPLTDPDLADEMSRLLPELTAKDRPAVAGLDSPGARDRFFDAVLRVVSGCGAAAVVVEDVHAASSASADLLAYFVHRLERLTCPLVLTWREPGLPPRHPVRLALGTGRHTEQTTALRLARLTRAEVAILARAADREPDLDQIWTETAGVPLLVVGALRADATQSTTVRDLLGARLAEVSEETAQVLAALAVLGGAADPGVLRGTSGRSENETVDAVEEALRVGLVREEPAGVAFTHEALRRVAYDGLSLVRRRLLHQRAAETLSVRRDALAHAGAIAGHFHAGGDDASAAQWAWTAAGHARELFAHAEALHHVQFAASLGRDDVEVALAEGDVLVALARYDQAREAFTRALAHLPAATSGVERAAIERRLADVHVRRGDWERAAAGLAAAAELATGDDVMLARLAADQAVVAVRRDRQDEADEHAAAAVAVAPGEAYVRNVAGLVALAGGDVNVAVTQFEASLGAEPDVVLRTAVLNNLARAHAAASRPVEALAAAQAALDLGRRHGDRHRLAALHANLADRLHEADRADEAMAELKQSAALFAEVGTDPLDRPDVWTLTTW